MKAILKRGGLLFVVVMSVRIAELVVWRRDSCDGFEWGLLALLWH